MTLDIAAMRAKAEQIRGPAKVLTLSLLDELAIAKADLAAEKARADMEGRESVANLKRAHKAEAALAAERRCAAEMAAALEDLRKQAETHRRQGMPGLMMHVHVDHIIALSDMALARRSGPDASGDALGAPVTKKEPSN